MAWGSPLKASPGPGRQRHSGLCCSSLAKKVPDEVYEVMAAEARHPLGFLLQFRFAFRKGYFKDLADIKVS